MIVTQGSKPVSATTPVKAQKSQRSERQKSASSRLSLQRAMGQQQQIAVLQRWSDMAQLSQQVCEQQQAELSYRYLYTALEQLRRPLQQNFQPQLSQNEHAVLIKQIAELLRWREQQFTGLDAELLPLAQQAVVYRRVFSSRIDLLTTRPQSEHITILIGRTGATVSLSLLAGASAEANLQHIQEAFARHQISVYLNAQQQLEFSALEAQKRKLEENWLLSGEGVRVAAGNPVSISLSLPLCRLGRLLQQLTPQQNPVTLTALLTEEQQFIRKQLKLIQQQQAELNAYINQLAPPVQPEQATELVAISSQLQRLMQPDSPKAITAFVAQSQASAFLVCYALQQAKRR